MRKSIIITATVLGCLSWVYFFIAAFNLPKCEHVYVTIEKAEIKVEQGSGFVSSVYHLPPTGKQDGPDLICVKCFHQRKQILDYGETKCNPSGWPVNLSVSSFALDTIGPTIKSNGYHFIIGDTLYWSK